jgi:hypothetical protein
VREEAKCEEESSARPLARDQGQPTWGDARSAVVRQEQGGGGRGQKHRALYEWVQHTQVKRGRSATKWARPVLKFSTISNLLHF